MRGDTVFHVLGRHSGREQDAHFGTFARHADAEQRLVELAGRTEWAAQYHDHGFVIREGVVGTDFVIPPLPKPRDAYVVQARQAEPGGSPTEVTVLRRDRAAGSPTEVTTYRRNYRMLHTFEPFRQGDRELALISRNYLATAVLDLSTGEVIAEEPVSDYGFCPVGFYVPDWWDVHTGVVIPGSPAWSSDDEWPTGDFGFVWGCVWGDDSSWKVQLLDLSRLREGILRREDRFGHLELSTAGHRPPWLDTDARLPSSPPTFIRVSRYEGKLRVAFDVEMQFDLTSGSPVDWTRTGISSLE